MTQAWDFVDDEILWGRVSRTILDKRIKECDLTVRSINCLVYNGFPERGSWRPINTIRELIELTEQELLYIPNFGRRSLNEVKHFLAEYGLELKRQPRNQ